MRFGRCPWVVGEEFPLDQERPTEVLCGARMIETRGGFRCTAGHRHEQTTTPAVDDPAEDWYD